MKRPYNAQAMALLSTPTATPLLQYLTAKNQTLRFSNNQPSGWQKQLACTLTFTNKHGITTLSQPSVIVDSVSTLYLWLAYEEQPLYPLWCGSHRSPLDECKILPNKISFRVRCGAKCFHRTSPLCLVLVECHQECYQWNFVKGLFRKLSHGGASSEPIKQQQRQRCEVQEVVNKLDALLSEVQSLTELTRGILETVQLQKQLAYSILVQQQTITHQKDIISSISTPSTTIPVHPLELSQPPLLINDMNTDMDMNTLERDLLGIMNDDWSDLSPFPEPTLHQ